MQTRYTVAAIWNSVPPGRDQALIEDLAALARTRAPATIFFRADDGGVPGRAHRRLTDLFARHAAPLCLAVVPGWLPMPARAFRDSLDLDAPCLCLHMHGFLHRNNEPRGQKMEFGPGLTLDRKRDMLRKGLALLRRHLGPAARPFFTPPWNNCDAQTMGAPRGTGLQGLSRCVGVLPAAPPGLAEFAVNVDLHTRRDPDPARDWEALGREFRAAVASGACGVMLHHQLMNDRAFCFLEALVERVSRDPAFRPVHFATMASGSAR
jgi:hypothetical protein